MTRHNCPLPTGSGLGEEGPLPRQLRLGVFQEQATAHRGVVKNYSYVPDDRLFDEICEIYEAVYPDLHSLLEQLIRHFAGIRIQIILPVHLVDPLRNREVDTYLNSFSYILTHPGQIDRVLCMTAATAIEKLNQFIENGSLWNLEYIRSLDLTVLAYEPILPRGGKRQTLPPWLKSRSSILNFKVPSDGRCFHLAVLASLHGGELAPSERDYTRSYEQFFELYDFSMLSPPVGLDQIGPFERENQISVNVFAAEGKKIYGVRISETDYVKACDLVILSKRGESETHYAGIFDFDKFANFKRDKPHYYCRRCLAGYKSTRVLKKHIPVCQIFNRDNQIIDMPAKGSLESFDVFKFEQAMLLHSGLGFFDFESYLQPVSGCLPQPGKSWSCKTQQHSPCSYVFLVVLQNLEIFHLNYYSGDDAVEHFLETASVVADRFLEFQKNNERVEMSEEEFLRHQTIVTCPVCDRTFDDGKHKKCIHHFHSISFTRVDDQGLPYRSNYLGKSHVFIVDQFIQLLLFYAQVLFAQHAI